MNDYHIVKKPSMIIVGIKCRTSNAPDAAAHDIPKLWEKFYKDNVIEKIPNKANGEIFALYCDYEGDHTQPYTVVIGCVTSKADKVPEGMIAKEIPSSSYALFRAIGEHPKALIKTWEKIWDTDLERTYSGDFEVYGEKFSESPQEVEVYVAIKK
jgi:predicted transcriptional regulator YdeE